ncbi:MAG TPA: class I SAM-dependent methyltransferase [bacterium]|nr:class I SAM-dependent methyltransferase [bacterium]HPN31256.1 class I SAM-dependent methyltransferase [bacterium]
MKKNIFIPKILYKKCRDLLQIILNSKYPADNEMSVFFRKNKNCGKNDRGFIAETVYGVLRNFKALNHIIDNIEFNMNQRADLLIIIYLIKYAGFDIKEILNISGAKLDVQHTEIIKNFKIESKAKNAYERISLKYSVPEWLVKTVELEFDLNETEKICESLNAEAKLHLRTNLSKISRFDLSGILESEGIHTKPAGYSPAGLIAEKKTNLFANKSFQNGLFEVQDEGSQLISYLADPRPGEIVVDGCCGAGGKTLHLSDLMKNKGILYAFDISGSRIENLRKRAKRDDFHNIRTEVLSDGGNHKLSRLNGKADRVLIDAPCSGCGVFRRNPDAKLRLKENEAKKIFPEKQLYLLDKYAPLAKKNGVVVYSTCSIVQYENEEVVKKFLESHKEFELTNASEFLKKYGIEINMKNDFLKLYPHLHFTDGFFAARLRKIK